MDKWLSLNKVLEPLDISILKKKKKRWEKEKRNLNTY